MRCSFWFLIRNNHRGAQRQVLLDAPVQLSQISADVGKESLISLLKPEEIIFHSTFTLCFSYSSKRRGRYLDDKESPEHGELKHRLALQNLWGGFFDSSLPVSHPQTVDAKKLEKAEAKLKAKSERRNEKDSQKPSSQL